MQNQSQLAKILGIERSYLNAILNGRRHPSIKLAKKISKLTGKNFFELRPDLAKVIRELL